MDPWEESYNYKQQKYLENIGRRDASPDTFEPESDEGRELAGLGARRKQSPKQQQEPGLFDKAWHAIFGDSAEDIKARDYNNRTYQQSLNQERANPSAPGTYWFNYNNPADYSTDKVARAIANGDLKETNKQLYRRYYDPKTNQMKYETLPVAEFDSNGSAKAIDYRAGAVESRNRMTAPAWSPLGPIGDYAYNKLTGQDKYTERDFQALARNAPDRNSFDTAATSFIDSAIDKWNPVDIANNLLDSNRKHRSAPEQYRLGDGRIDASDASEILGGLASDIAQMALGEGVAKAAYESGIGAIEATKYGAKYLPSLLRGEKAIEEVGRLGGAVAPEIKRALTEGSETGEWRNALSDAAINTAGNYGAMKIAGAYAPKLSEAMGKMVDPITGDIINTGSKNLGKAAGILAKSTLAQTGVNAVQAAGEVYLDDRKDAGLEQQLYGRQVGDTADFLKKWGLRTAMSLAFNGLSEFGMAGLGKIADGIKRRYGMADKIDGIAKDIVANAGTKLTQEDITRIVKQDKNVYSQWTRDLLENRLKEHAGLTNPADVTNSIIANLYDGLSNEEILKKLVADRVVMLPEDIRLAKEGTIPYLRKATVDAPTAMIDGKPAKLQAYMDFDINGQPQIAYRYTQNEPTISQTSVPTNSAKPSGSFVYDNIDGKVTINPQSTSAMASYVRDMTINGENPAVMELLTKPFSTATGVDFNNPKGIQQLISTYANITGESVRDKPIADVVDRLMLHLSGGADPSYWNGNPGKFIDKMAMSNLELSLPDQLAAFGDRARMYDQMQHMPMFNDMSVQERADYISKLYDYKIDKKSNIPLALQFASATQQKKMSLKDMLERIGTAGAPRQLEGKPMPRLAPTPEGVARGVIEPDKAMFPPEELVRYSNDNPEFAKEVSKIVNPNQYREPPTPPEITPEMIQKLYETPAVDNGGQFTDNPEYLDRIQKFYSDGQNPWQETYNPEETNRFNDYINNMSNMYPEERAIKNTPEYNPYIDVPKTLTPEAIEAGNKKYADEQYNNLIESSKQKEPEVSDAQRLLDLVQKKQAINEPVEAKVPSEIKSIDEPKQINGEPATGQIEQSVKPVENPKPEPAIEPVQPEKVIVPPVKELPKKDVIIGKEEPTVEPSVEVKPIIDEKPKDIIEAIDEVKTKPVEDRVPVKGDENSDEHIGKTIAIKESPKPIDEKRIDETVGDDGIIPDDRATTIDHPSNDIEEIDIGDLDFGKMDIPEKQYPKDTKFKNFWNGYDKADYSKEEQRIIKETLGADKGVLTEEDMDRVSKALMTGESNSSKPEVPATPKANDTHDSMAKDIEELDLDKFISDYKASNNSQESIGDIEELPTIGYNKKPEVDFDTPSKDASDLYDKLVNKYGSAENLSSKIKEIMPDDYIVSVGSSKQGKMGTDKVSIMIRPNPKKSPSRNADEIIGLQKKLADELGLHKDDIKLLRKTMGGQLSITGDRAVKTVAVDHKRGDEIRSDIMQSFMDNPDPRVKVMPDADGTNKMVLNNFHIDDYEKELQKRGFSLDDIHTSYKTKNIEAYRARGKSGSNWSILGINTRNTLQANPLVIGGGLATLGVIMDRDDDNPSPIGKALKVIGYATMATYGGMKLHGISKKLMSTSVRDKDGNVSVSVNLLDRLKSEPATSFKDSPIAKLTREQLMSGVDGKDRSILDKRRMDFEKNDKIFSQASFESHRSLAHIKGGSYVDRLKNAAVEGGFRRDRMVSKVMKMDEELNDIVGKDKDFIGKVVKANDSIYKRTTKIWNTQNFDRDAIAAKYPDVKYVRDRIVKFKSDLIKAETTPEKIKSALLEAGVPSSELSKGMEAYNKFRDIQNTMTGHFSEAWLDSYRIDKNKIDEEITKLENVFTPLVEEAKLSKNRLADMNKLLKASPKNEALKMSIKAEKLNLQDVASQMKQVKNKIGFIKYASEFDDQSAMMHHISNRWDMARENKPYGLAMYEVADNGMGKYTRVNDAVTIEPGRMNYYKAKEERNTAEKGLISEFNLKPVDGNPKIFQATKDGKSFYVKVENEIDDNLSKRWLTQNIQLAKEQILSLLKTDNDVPAMRDKVMNILKDIRGTSDPDVAGEHTVEDSALLNDLVDASEKAFEGTNSRAQLISNLKDVFTYTLQPKARPFRRNKNVVGYEPTDDSGWWKMYQIGKDNVLNNVGNRFQGNAFRTEVENQLMEGIECGYKGKYIDYLQNLLSEANTSNVNNPNKIEELIPNVVKAVKYVEAVSCAGVMGFNVSAAKTNVVLGQLSNAIGLIGEKVNPLRLIGSAKGIASALRDKEDAYSDPVLNALHNSIMENRVPFSTTVEHLGKDGIKFPESMFKLVQWGETINRYSGAFTYAKALAERSPKPADMPMKEYADDIVKKAANFVYETQGNYDYLWRSQFEKAMLKNMPLGKTFLTLVSPAINQTTMYANIMRRMVTMDENRKHYLAHGLAMMVLVPLVGGVNAIPGISELSKVMDYVNDLTGDKDQFDTKQSTIDKIGSEIGDMAAKIGVPKEHINDVIMTYKKGILSALTDVDFSQDAGISGMAIPFIAQKIAKTISTDIPGLANGDDVMSSFINLLSSNVPALGRAFKAGRQLVRGERLDASGNPMGKKYGVSDAIIEGLMGTSATQRAASEAARENSDYGSPQSSHEMINELRNMKGLSLNAKDKEEIATSGLFNNKRELLSALRAEANKLNSRDAIGNSNKLTSDWINSNNEIAMRLAGKWYASETPEYEGSNRDMKSLQKSLKSAVDRYYKATALSEVVNNKTDKQTSVAYDKQKVPNALNSGYRTVGDAPYEERGYLYVMSKFLGKKKKLGYDDEDYE